MKRPIFYLVTLWLAALTALAFAPLAASSPVQTVERLAYARESRAAAAAGIHLLSVKCAASSRAYIYVCNFRAPRRCAATYVHYNARLDAQRVNFWGQSWPCGSRPPYAAPAYPGDGGPGA